MPMEETFYRTKRFFHKTSRNIKSFLLVGYEKLPKIPFANPIFSGSNKIGPKLQELDNFYRSFSKRWDSSKAVNKKEGLLTLKEQTKGDEQCSKNSIGVSDHTGLEDLKEEKKASKYSGGKQEQSSFLATDNLAEKMKELEMMDVNDGDHVLDIEEVLHYYSLLTCPAYLEIVDKFFVDMYSELYLPRPTTSVNSSMRRLGSASVHSSMRKPGSASVHSSMRSLGPLKL
ncbi:hypothetical protein Pfo_020000 [Paulownia fortunei]|nr:hypothetical protein Pfo_020000 [Paulownia fortunei]